MGIFNRIAKIVKAEMNYRLRQSGLYDEPDVLSSDLEAEIRNLEEELRQAEEAENRWQRTRQRADNSHYRSRASRTVQMTAYDTLDVSPDISQQELKKKYRELAKKYHPDRVQKLSPEMQQKAKQKMKEINLAYDQIEDPIKRQAYNKKIGIV